VTDVPRGQVGEFEIVTELARNESGIVYEARDTVLGRTVTLQFLPPRTKPDAVASLDHPNIGTIYQVGETPAGIPFIVMAKYEGETARERSSRISLHPKEIFDIVRQVAAALSVAHAAGVVHGHVHASNIFLTRRGTVKLLGFGVAPANATIAGDIHSLGVVAQEMLGTRSVRGSAAAVLQRMVAATPEKYPAAIELIRDLDRLIRDWSRPRNIAIAFAGALALLTVIGIGARRVSKLPEASHIPELAVLQVAGDSTDREILELASALRDEIAARLVALKRVRLVRVRPDSTGKAPSRSGLDLLELAISKGSAGASVAISLRDSRTERILWSDRRAFSRSELRELGRDVVVGVLASLGQPATTDERRIIGSGFPSSAEAYEEFLTGNRELARRSPPSIESALHHFRRASELDSTFAAAVARQAYGYAVLVDWGWKPSSDLPADMLNEAIALADRATRLDSTAADAWLARAYVMRQRDPRKFVGATQAFEHAIALDPYNAEAFHQYGQTLMALGRYTEAIAAYRRSLNLEPGRATELVPLAAIDERQGRLREGLRLLDSAVSAAPQVGYVRATRSMFRSQAGDLNGAKKDAMDALALDSAYRMPGLAALTRVLWLEGDTAGALARVAEAERAISNVAAPDPTEAFWLAMAEVATQRPMKAVELLNNSRPRGAWLWFYFGAGDLSDFRKRSDASALLAAMDPRIQ